MDVRQSPLGQQLIHPMLMARVILYLLANHLTRLDIK